jgi:hypothetical protein
MLNDRENLFDLAHLNEKGAEIFTEIFAGEFIRRVDMQNGLEPVQNDLPAITGSDKQVSGTTGESL